MDKIGNIHRSKLKKCKKGDYIMQNPDWLTKQMVRNINKTYLDAYLLALEGWRRGLSLRWYAHNANIIKHRELDNGLNGQIFSLSSGDKTYYFLDSKEENVNKKINKLLNNRDKLFKILKQNKLNIPKFIQHHGPTTQEEIKSSIYNIGLPVKIILFYKGTEKNINLVSESQLIKFIEKLVDKKYDSIFIKQEILSQKYNLLVVNNKIVGAIRKTRPTITGNNNTSIEELILKKYSSDKNNKYSYNKLSINDELINFIEDKGYKLTSVIPDGEELILSNKYKVIQDVKDILPGQLKSIVYKLTDEILGLEYAEIEITECNETYYVTDVANKPKLYSYIFPTLGKSRNVAEKVIDHYFPETKDFNKDRTKIYFDYRRIRSLLNNMLAQEVLVPDAPNGKLYAKRYVISGKVQKVGYRNWIRRQAGKYKLHGYTRNLNNGSVVVVVAGDDKDIINDFKKICYKGPKNAKVTNIKEYDWTTQIKSGFEIRKTR